MLVLIRVTEAKKSDGSDVLWKMDGEVRLGIPQDGKIPEKAFIMNGKTCGDALFSSAVKIDCGPEIGYFSNGIKKPIGDVEKASKVTANELRSYSKNGVCYGWILHDVRSHILGLSSSIRNSLEDSWCNRPAIPQSWRYVTFGMREEKAIWLSVRPEWAYLLFKKDPASRKGMEIRKTKPKEIPLL